MLVRIAIVYYAVRDIQGLGVPDLSDSFSDTDVVCFVVVETVKGEGRAAPEGALGDLVPDAIDPRWDVVDDTRLEADVRVDDEDGAEDSVQDRGHGVSERQDCQWDQGYGHDTLEAPVVRAMDSVGLGKLSSLVDGANNATRRLGDGAADMSQAQGSCRTHKHARSRTHGAAQGTGSESAQ
ncbi:hypothetical protein TRICI_006289 [Trichomonascus ciferrii]|uniref:Uncharacterized protein n=1 Tax=Trichomonascus ciferrii TaxID=44093 RepID=A0A642UJ43_9ASCO|nr:hypothetical protein TRICI_006289 [Trichomonascus ciferrii]